MWVNVPGANQSELRNAEIQWPVSRYHHAFTTVWIQRRTVLWGQLQWWRRTPLSSLWCLWVFWIHLQPCHQHLNRNLHQLWWPLLLLLLTYKIWPLTFDLWHMKSEVWNLTSEIWNLISDISHLTSHIWYLVSGIWHLTSDIYYLTSGKWHLESYI